MQAVVPTFKEKSVAQRNRTRTVHVQGYQGSQRVRVPTNVVNVYFENGYFKTGWQGSHEFEVYTSIPEGTEVEIEFCGKQTSIPGPFGEDVSYRMNWSKNNTI